MDKSLSERFVRMKYRMYVPLLNGDVVGHLVHHLAQSLTFDLIHHSVQHFHETTKLQHSRNVNVLTSDV